MTSESPNGRKIDDVLQRIHELVHAREVLGRYGVTDGELDVASAEISELQWRLARLVKDDVEHGRIAA
jgi:hypothetical protein